MGLAVAVLLEAAHAPLDRPQVKQEPRPQAHLAEWQPVRFAPAIAVLAESDMIAKLADRRYWPTIPVVSYLRNAGGNHPYFCPMDIAGRNPKRPVVPEELG